MDGTTWVWGNDPYGNLGDGTDLKRNIPLLVAEDTGLVTATKAAAGKQYSLIIDASGQVWGWGYNEYGQLGDETNIDKNKPVKVAMDTGLTNVLAIAAGEYHSLAIDDTHQVWAWGANEDGQLGDGTTIDSNTPIKVAMDTGLDHVIAIAAGEYHSLAIDATGQVWAWGANDYGQLGDGTDTSCNKPIKVAADTGLDPIIAIAAGDSHSLAIDITGQAWSWGSNRTGQLGDGTNIARNKPGRVTADTGLASVIAIAAGRYHSVTIGDTGQVWAWGANKDGQLGDGTWDDKNQPVLIATDKGFSAVVNITAGGKHNLIIDINNKIWAWGSDYYGQLGDGNSSQKITPVLVAQSTGLTTAVAISAGNEHSLVIDAVDQAWAWGYNGNGQLGDGTNTDRNKPNNVAVDTGLAKVIAISAGYSHNLAIDDTGQAWAWGANWSGQLGDGTSTRRNKPIKVAVDTGLAKVIAIAVGHSHSLVIDATGQAWAWGANGSGQLGNGTNTNRTKPVKVAVDTGLSSVIAIAAGDSYSLAIDTSGQAWAWGANWSGQLGDGTTTSHNKPIKVAIDTGLASVIAIAASNSSNLAIDGTGQAWAWGYNDYGQLGDGTNTSSNKPVKVATDTGLTHVMAIAAATSHSLAIDNTGQAWAWGANWSGQLGDGTNTNRNKPTLVVKDTGLNAVLKVSGGTYSLALTGITKLSCPIKASPDPVRVGQNLTYNITITNTGSAPATNLQLTNKLPTNVELISTIGCSETNGTITCNLGTLNTNTSITVFLVVKPKEREIITNTISVKCDELPNPLVDTINTQVVAPEGFTTAIIKRNWRKNPPI